LLFWLPLDHYIAELCGMLLKRLSKTLDDPHLRQLARLAAMCVVTGLVAGLGAVAFFGMLEGGREFFQGYLANYHPASPGYEKPWLEFGSLFGGGVRIRWLLLILPAFGGLLSGLLVFWLAPEAEGHGTDAAIEAYHFKDGAVRKRVPLIKAIASMLIIGTGGSAGREGPVAQIGSGFGSMLGEWFRVTPHERRILMASGMAAGIGAIFHAPLAGALFVTEVLYRDPDFEHEVLVPSFISSIVAYSVFGSIFGFHPLFVTPEYTFSQVTLLLPFFILAIVMAFGAMLYVKAFYGMRHLMFGVFKLPNFIKPVIGGFLVGLVGFLLPEAIGTGYGVVQMLFNDKVASLPSAGPLLHLLPEGFGPAGAAALLLAVVGLAKIGTTAFTVGSGGSGGVFGPAVVIGGCLGGATGLLCAQLFPGMGIHAGAFALVGMAGFFAGAANTPVSTIIMVSEMTGNYNLLLPSMLVCIISFALCRRFTLYEKQLPSRLEAPSKLGNMAGAILRHLTVGQAVHERPDGKLVLVDGDMTLGELIEEFAYSTQACFPVVDNEGLMTGVIDSRNIRRIVTEPGMADLIIARDIEVPATTVTLHESLLAALNNMVQSQSDEIVVVDERESRQPTTTLSRNDIIATYNRQIAGQLEMDGSPND
jgi:CIC family chloride channel protein